MSRSQRVAAIVLLVLFPIGFLVARVFGTLPVGVLVVAFVYPVAIMFFAWSLVSTRLPIDETARRRQPFGLGLGPEVPNRIGGPMTVTASLALSMIVWMPLSSRGARGHESWMLGLLAWWIVSSLFIAFVLPRFLRGETRS